MSLGQPQRPNPHIHRSIYWIELFFTQPPKVSILLLSFLGWQLRDITLTVTMLPRGRHWLCDLRRRTRSMLRRSKVSKLKWLLGLMGEMFPILLYRVIQCQCHTFPLNFQIWFAIVMWFNCVALAADDTQQCAKEMKVSTRDIALLSHQFPCSHFVSSLFCDSSRKWIWRQEKRHKLSSLSSFIPYRPTYLVWWFRPICKVCANDWIQMGWSMITFPNFRGEHTQGSPQKDWVPVQHHPARCGKGPGFKKTRYIIYTNLLQTQKYDDTRLWTNMQHKHDNILMNWYMFQRFSMWYFSLCSPITRRTSMQQFAWA